MINNKIKIFLIATEQSGDNLGSSLIKSLKLNSQYSFVFFGIGGDKMINEGLRITNHISEFKSLGFFEILLNLKKILLILNLNVSKAYDFDPDIVITIDSPDFSFRFVKKLKNKKIKTKYVHYVAPTVWAWRAGRAKYISKFYDLLLSIFPFENSYFEKYKLKTVFVGNPICENILPEKKIDNKMYIAFLPGSRINEINSLIPYFKSLNEYIFSSYSNYKIFIPTLSHLKKDIISSSKDWPIKPIITDDMQKINNLYSQTKLSIVCSGTASLEVSIRKIPLIVIYKLNIFTEILFSFFVKTKFANIINIIAQNEIIPELTNHKLTKKKLIKKFSNLLNQNHLQEKQIYESQKILKLLCTKKNYSINASNEILKII